MADFAPPAGPPPPKVPEGWKAIWNDQYSEWFYVNIYTKKSQWEKPTEPVYPPPETAPNGPPPSYPATAESNKTGFSSNNPYANITDDERLARQLQDEENARAQQHAGQPVPGAGGATNDYYGQPGAAASTSAQPGTPEPQTHERSKSKSGFLGKLLAKAGSHRPQQAGYSQPHYGATHGGYAQPYGPPMGYGGHPQQQYGRRPGGGMGAGGAAALGAGGGLLGGMMLADAADGGDDGGFGGDDGGFGGDGGGDFGGGDFGGGGDGGGGGGC